MTKNIANYWGSTASLRGLRDAICTGNRSIVQQASWTSVLTLAHKHFSISEKLD